MGFQNLELDAEMLPEGLKAKKTRLIQKFKGKVLESYLID